MPLKKKGSNIRPKRVVQKRSGSKISPVKFIYLISESHSQNNNSRLTTTTIRIRKSISTHDAGRVLKKFQITSYVLCSVAYVRTLIT